MLRPRQSHLRMIQEKKTTSSSTSAPRHRETLDPATYTKCHLHVPMMTTTTVSPMMFLRRGKEIPVPVQTATGHALFQSPQVEIQQIVTTTRHLLVWIPRLPQKETSRPRDPRGLHEMTGPSTTPICPQI